MKYFLFTFVRLFKIPMAYKRRGHLTVIVEYCVHLRRFMHRKYWKAERKAGKKLIRKELTEYKRPAA